MLGNRGFPEAWSRLCVCQASFLMTFAMGGVPHAGPRQVSILHSSFFMVQLSHWYMTSGKTTALTIQIFVGKVMSLLFNTMCRFVIAFLPRSKHLLISWLQSPPTVISERKKIKFVTASTFPPSICLEVMGLEAIILVFSMLSSKPAFSLLFHPQEAL